MTVGTIMVQEAEWRKLKGLSQTLLKLGERSEDEADAEMFDFLSCSLWEIIKDAEAYTFGAVAEDKELPF